MSEVVIQVRSIELAHAFRRSLADSGFAAELDATGRVIHVDLPREKAVRNLFGVLATSLGAAADGYATIRLDGRSYVFEPAQEPGGG